MTQDEPCLIGKAQAVRIIRANGEALDDEEQRDLAVAVADYIEGTDSDDPALLAEVAMAYMAGYGWSMAEHPREVWAILRAVRMTR
jgi:hypothetical protein